MRRLTGGLLVAVPVAFTAIFVALGAVFDYPDILDASTGEVLRRFAAEGDGLVALWYGFMLTAVMFVPIAVLLPRVLAMSGALGAAAVVFGVLAGALQILGLARWPFLVPYLAETYLDPQASPAARESAGVTFQAFHRGRGSPGSAPSRRSASPRAWPNRSSTPQAPSTPWPIAPGPSGS